MRFITSFVLLVLLSATFSFCKKESAKKTRSDFIATIDTWYRVSPITPEPLQINNQDYLGVMHFPGGGTGTVSVMGNSTNLFNQLAYVQPPGQDILGSVSAPVSQIGTYPVAGDFTQLTTATAPFQIPERVGNNIVNSVLYNNNGDAIFTSAITGSGSTVPVSATRINFNGKGLIVGGRGRFANATGEFDFNGYFNPGDQSDAEYNADGWIEY